MKVTDAEIIISAVSQQQYPADKLPEIALAGRSNVGKSSLINKLIQRKHLARTSSKPGKTQTLNFYKINNLFYFVDAPGYGYAKVSKQERQKWGAMMEEYFASRKVLEGCIMITDSRHEPTDNDVVMYDFLKAYNLPVLVIATKLDKVPKGKRAKYLSQTTQVLAIEAEDTIIPFSAETGEGVHDIWSWINQFISS